MRLNIIGLLIWLVSFSFNLKAQNPHPERVYLSGTDCEHPETWEFFCSKGNQSGQWRNIEVPCSWELQGFGQYTYGRWYKVKGEKPSDETGIYRCRFDAPLSWKGQRVVLFFDGVMTDCEVLVNNRVAGVRHQGGFYRFSYDVTDLLDWGKENTLTVHVAKHSANRSVNAAERKADWWLFGGIYRPVWLEVLPVTHIRHYLVDAAHDGRFRMTACVNGEAEGCRVTVSVRELISKKPLCTVQGKQTLEAVVKKQASEVQLEGKWMDVKSWNTESPTLYEACIQLYDAQGKLLQSRCTRIGFRTVEFFPQDGLYLNGTKLVLKGVNRHSFSVDGGRATSVAQSRQDALLIKEMNMNAVRSHYPPDEHFLDMCDSLGLVYMDELAGWQNAYDDTIAPRLIREMIERDVNHPCIVIWSHGNEGGWNTSADSLFAQHDALQKRHLVHPWADFNDLDTHHYPAYLTGVGRFTNGYKVFMPTEFMHAMYDQGGGAGLRDFWDRWNTNPLFAGGFIWAFCDEAPKRTDRNGVLDSNQSNAPDGIVGPRREKEGSFYAIRAQWSPIQLSPLMITAHFKGRFLLTNEFLFTNLADCHMEYRVKKCAMPFVQSLPLSAVELAAGQVTLPALSVGETGTASFVLPDVFWEGDLLELEAFDASGRSICTWTYPIRFASSYFEHQLASVQPSHFKKPLLEEKEGMVKLSAQGVSVVFDRTNGLLTRVEVGDKLIPLTDGPLPVGMKMRYDSAASYVRSSAQEAVFCAKYKGGADSIVWRLQSNGLLYMDALLLNRASGGGGFDDGFMDTQIYNLGLTFRFPEQETAGMQWFGRGPYRVWKNRIAGTQYGIWHKDYNNTITGESFENLIYPEFKGYHANMYWAKLKNRTKDFTVYSRSDGIYYRIFTPQEPKGSAKPTMPDFPEGDLSFLLDIPAICSFKPIEQQGPNSQPGSIRIKKGDEGLHLNLVFDFLN